MASLALLPFWVYSLQKVNHHKGTGLAVVGLTTSPLPRQNTAMFKIIGRSAAPKPQIVNDSPNATADQSSFVKEWLACQNFIEDSP